MRSDTFCNRKDELLKSQKWYLFGRTIFSLDTFQMWLSNFQKKLQYKLLFFVFHKCSKNHKFITSALLSLFKSYSIFLIWQEYPSLWIKHTLKCDDLCTMGVCIKPYTYKGLRDVLGHVLPTAVSRGFNCH